MKILYQTDQPFVGSLHLQCCQRTSVCNGAMSLSSRWGSSEPRRTFSKMHDHSGKLMASCQPYWNAPISNAQPDKRLRLLLSEILNVNGIARDLDGKLMISSILFPLLLLVESFSFVLLVFHLSTQGQKVLCSLLCSFTPRLWPQVWEFAAVGSVETVVKPIESQQKKRAALSFALQSHTKCLCNWPKQILKERAIQNDMKMLPSSQT